MQTKICIYCAQNDVKKFKGVEHVLPQAFGTFGSKTPTLDCVCDDCNQHFGQHHDVYLARDTIEGVIRYSRGKFSSEARPQKHLNITLEPGPEVGQFAGMKVAIDGTSGELMKFKSQFRILNQVTGRTEIYFKEQLINLDLPEGTYGKPGNSEVKGTWVCDIMAATKEEHDEIAAILNANNIAFVPGEPFPIPKPITQNKDGKHTVSLSMEGEVGLEHKQAHAKIFLNFIAKYLGLAEAIKSDWDFLRRYARYGEGVIKCRMSEQNPDTEEKLQILLRHSILIKIQNMQGHVVGTIRFYGNHTYQYILRENASVSNDQEFGFIFTDGTEPERLPFV